MARLSMFEAAIATLLLCVVTAVTSYGQTFTKLVDFDGTNGSNPEYMSFVQGANGSLYGTSQGGTGCGGYGCGTVLSITPSGALTTLYNFDGIDGDGPYAGLTLGTDGSFYGTTTGGNHDGTVYKITPDGPVTVLYNFCSQPGCTDGLYPYSKLVQGIDGNFYGTTVGGGGTVFRITPSGTLTTLQSVDGGPYAGLLLATDGNFYGTTYQGGAFNAGTIFKISPSGKLTTLHSFGSGSDGALLYGGLIQATDGNFYGTTQFGGAYDWGTVFKMTRGGTVTTLHSFCFESGCPDGASPYGSLFQATDANLYGTTYQGGDIGSNVGTIFKITLGGVLTSLHTFNGRDGAHPVGALAQASDGVLYGTTVIGGSEGDGTIFTLDMGLGPFVSFVRGYGRVGQTGGILGQGFTGTTSVSLNGTPARFKVVSDTFIRATVPAGATTGFVTVTTPSGTLTSNVPFHVIP